MLGVALRGIRWRRGTSLGLFAVAAVVVLAAAIGPTYLHASGESLLQDALHSAGVNRTGYEVLSSTGLDSHSDDTLDAQLARAGDLPLHQRPVHVLEASRSVGPFVVGLNARDRVCAHVSIVAGRCPSAAGDVMVTARTLERTGWRLGLALSTFPARAFSEEPLVVRIVGVYEAPDVRDPYWYGDDPADAAPEGNGGQGVSVPERLDRFFTPQETFDLGRERVNGSARVLQPLDPGLVRVEDEGRLRAAVQQRTAGMLAQDGTLSLVDSLPIVLDGTDGQRRRLALALALVTAPLILLGLLVLLLLVSAAAEARGPEVALAKLRGLSPVGVVVFTLLEPVLVVAAAAPVGLLLAALVSRRLADARLLPGTPAPVTVGAVLAALAALAGLVIAVALAARRVLTRPVVEQWRRTPGSAGRPRGAALWLDAVVVVAAAAGVAVLRRRGDEITLAAPLLLAAAAGLLAVRALPLACRPALARSRGGARLARFLALRQVVRRPAGVRVVALLVVAFTLATTAVSAWSVSLRGTRARGFAEVGADRVLSVRVPDNTDLAALVRRVDPSGQSMAVSDYIPFGSDRGGRVVAVDTTRFATVAHWAGDFASRSAAAVAADIRAGASTTTPPVILAGATLPNVDVGATTTVTGVDGQQLPVQVVGRVDVLPRAAGNGTLVDAEAARGAVTSPQQSFDEVWATDAAPADLAERLTRAGLTVTETETGAERTAMYRRQGPALALLVFVVAATLATVLAAGAVIAFLYAVGRRRAYELAALSALGVPRRVQWRSCLGEQLLLLATGVGVGAVAGAVACWLALPSVPQFVDDVTAPPLHFVPSPISLAILLLGATALVLAAAAFAASTVVRAGVPDRLREAQA